MRLLARVIVHRKQPQKPTTDDDEVQKRVPDNR
jgi:hypothetical protein